MGIRAKQMQTGTFDATAQGRASFGAGLFDATLASSVFAAGAIPGSKLASGGVDETALAASVAGNGITGGAGTALSVEPDVTTGGGVPGVEVAANGLRLAAAAAGAGLVGGAGAALGVGAGTGMVANANDVALNVAAGTPTYSGTHVSTHTVDTLQVTGAPGTANDPINKAYLDSVLAGQLWKPAAKLTTTAALPAVTYANGTGGVGATLVASAVGILTVDSVATVLGDRILVKDQGTGLQNGIYEVTTEGTAGVAFVLTRTVDADNSPSNELEAAAIFTTAGTLNANLTFTQTATTVTVGTTALVWVQSAGANAANAGAGMSAAGNVFNVGAGNGVSVAADTVAVNPDTTTGLNIAPLNVVANGAGLDIAAVAGTGIEADGAANLRLAAQGNGIAGGAGSTLSVNADSTTGANIQPANVVANGVGLDIAAIAGTGIEADGAANLRVAAQGNGIAGGAGATLSVDPLDASITVAAGGVSVNPAALLQGAVQQLDGDKVDADFVPANYTQATGTVGGVTGTLAGHLTAHLGGIDAELATIAAATSTPTVQDKNIVAALTAADGAASGAAITSTPVANGYVKAEVNGIGYAVGDGVKTTDCYFSGDGGTTARAIAAIVATDTLRWNGSIAGFELAVTDRIDLHYDL